MQLYSSKKCLFLGVSVMRANSSRKQVNSVPFTSTMLKKVQIFLVEVSGWAEQREKLQKLLEPLTLSPTHILRHCGAWKITGLNHLGPGGGLGCTMRNSRASFY